VVDGNDSELRKAARQSVLTMGWDKVLDSFEGRLSKLPGGRFNARGSSVRKPGTMEFRIVFLSDIHLGTQDSKVKEVIDCRKHCTFEKLVFNGDIIDDWALRRGGNRKKSHSKFVRYIFKIMESKDTQVVYLPGNHDDFLPMAFGPMKMVKEHVHHALNGFDDLVVHGDGYLEAGEQESGAVSLLLPLVGVLEGLGRETGETGETARQFLKIPRLASFDP
jgi:predicted phosphodiesterase